MAGPRPGSTGKDDRSLDMAVVSLSGGMIDVAPTITTSCAEVASHPVLYTLSFVPHLLQTPIHWPETDNFCTADCKDCQLSISASHHHACHSAPVYIAGRFESLASPIAKVTHSLGIAGAMA